MGVEGEMSVAERLFGWTPFRVHAEGGDLRVDWCHLGLARMVEPFHDQTITEAMRAPFNLAFQQHTPLAALESLPPGLPVAGFVFHMSRSGSTLVSQALAAFESDIVVSEPAPLRTVLRAHAVGRLDAAGAAAALRGLVNAYAQQRFAYEARAFVKFMAADLLDIALVRQAFPEVPWIVMTRDPAEILTSLRRAGGIDMVRGQIPAARLGLTEEALWRMDVTEYRASVLAAFARAARLAQDGGRGLILDHADLPEALWTRVLPHFGLVPDPGAIALIRAVCGRHAKRPAEPFAPERDPNRAGASAFRAVADAIAGPEMAALAALRSA